MENHGGKQSYETWKMGQNSSYFVYSGYYFFFKMMFNNEDFKWLKKRIVKWKKKNYEVALMKFSVMKISNEQYDVVRKR